MSNETEILIAQKPSSKDTHVQLQEGITHADDKYCFGLSKRSFHFLSLFITCFLWINIITLIVVLSIHNSTASIIVGILTGISVIFYFIETLASGTFRYLIRFKTVESVVDYIKRLKSYPPSIIFRCECYHYETRTRQVSETYTDANGNLQTRYRTETYQERVVTYVGTEHFKYNSWEDATPNLTSEILRFKVTRIDFSKNYDFKDSHSKKIHDAQYQQFRDRYKNRDTHFSHYIDYSIKDFHGKMMALVDGYKRPFFMHWSIFLLFSILLLSYPYRLWLDRTTVKGKFKFCKTVSC